MKRMLLASHALAAIAMLSHREAVAAAPHDQGLMSIGHTGYQDDAIAMSVAGAADHKLQNLRTHPAAGPGHDAFNSAITTANNGGPTGSGSEQHILSIGDAGTSNILPDGGAVNNDLVGGHGRGAVNVGNAVGLPDGGAISAG